MKIKITTLIENSLKDNNSLSCEHGLSLYIQVDGRNILFDTGQSGEFIKNAEKLNIDLRHIDYLVLSHGHDDHTGGFTAFYKHFGNSYPLIIGESFFNEKYKKVADGNYVYDGNPFSESLFAGFHIEKIGNEVVKLSEHIYVLSHFLSNNDFELSNFKYCIKQDNQYVIDQFQEEVALIIKLNKGLIVFLGCSHIGLVNILTSIMEKMHAPIYGVIGGGHLINAEYKRIEQTVAFFKKNNIKLIALSHCTGNYAVDKFKSEFKDIVIDNHTGNIIEINQ